MTLFFSFFQAQIKKAAEEAEEQRDSQDRIRLEILKQKSRHDQSAVASPEVKRHLAEFVLKKRSKEGVPAGVIGSGTAAGASGTSQATSPASAAASMGNLKLIMPKEGSASGQVGNPTGGQPILRKTASESNLLKIKSKRNSSLCSAPYHRSQVRRPYALYTELVKCTLHYS